MRNNPKFIELTPLIAVLAVAACLLPASAAATDEATGIVFHDVNGDGIRQATEPGIGHVAVSDGHRVVRTDADGR